jgi:hypothetical protein
MIPIQRKEKAAKSAVVIGAIIFIALVGGVFPFSVVPSTAIPVSQVDDCRLVAPLKASILCKDANTVSKAIKVIPGKTETLVMPNGHAGKLTFTMTGGGPGQTDAHLFIREGSKDGILVYRAKMSGTISIKPNTVYFLNAQHECAFPTCIPASNDYHIAATWSKTFLYYSDPHTGEGTPITGTDYCIPQVGTLSQIESSLDVIPQSQDAKSSVMDETGARSAGFERGRGFKQVLGLYSELANIGSDVYPYGGVDYLATCDQENKRVHLYERVNALVSGCYAVPGATVIDGKYWDDVFCCRDSFCKVSFGATYACENYKCIDKGVSGDPCKTSADCQQPFFEDNKGQAYSVEGVCAQGTCVYTYIKEACMPGKQYWDADGKELCCIATGTGFKLGPCAAIPKACPAGMCCLEGNKPGYMVQLPPTGKQCCDGDNDGVGYVAESCDPGLNLGPFQWLADMFGGDIWGMLIALIVIIFAIFLLIMVLGMAFN